MSLFVHLVINLHFVFFFIYEYIKIFLEFLDSTQTLFIISLSLTVVYVIYLQLYFIFYKAYSSVKKLNDRRRMCADENSYMGLNISHARPPTKV